MKKINIISIFFTASLLLPSSLFAWGTFYVWVATPTAYSDVGVLEEWKHLPQYGRAIPEINSIIEIKAGNKKYTGFNIIQELSNGFSKLIFKEKNCKHINSIAGFNAYMLDIYPICSSQRIIDEIKYKYIQKFSFDTNPYFVSKYPTKAKVLGYVKFIAGTFMLIEDLGPIGKIDYIVH